MTRALLSLLLAAAWCSAAELKPEAAQAFERYIRDTEARLAADQGPFLWSAREPDRLREVRQGQVLVEPRVDKGATSAPGALIHDWIGAVFIPGATLAKTLAVLQDYDHQQDIYRGEVLESKLLARHGNDFEYYRLRRLNKGVVNAVMRTEFEAHYQQVDAQRWRCWTRSTRIAELENPGKPNQRELPPGRDHGYLWRLHGYWRLEQRDGGVYLECEAVSLTRAVPAGLGWMFEPAVRNLEREGLQATLQATRDAVRRP